MKIALPLLLASCAAPAASAENLWVHLDFRFSTDGGATWASQVDALPGSTVRVGVFVLHNGWDFANANIRMSTNGLADADAVSYASGTNQGCTSNIGHPVENAIFRTPGAARFDRASDLDGSNDRTNTYFALEELDLSVPVPERNVFAFEIALDALAAPRDIEVRFDSFGLGAVNIWVPELGLGRPLGALPTYDNNVIHVVPAPASLALAGAAALAAGRRRRR